ncbi:nucleolin 2-like [Papaver somniferum]|uniref:nucleolin 2-like n=1 Tax=Papaver somniferum TaxID=3469 RepID=UPI000E6F4E99|nr:nucleolin 2-like [Papaver somniferum]
MGKLSNRSEVVAAVSHAFVNSGQGNNNKDANKRDAEGKEIAQKLNLKKMKKFYEPENRDCSLKALHDISYDEFITQTWIGEDSSAKPGKRTAASKTLIASNLPVSIDKAHVIHFFKQVGDDIVDVRFYFYKGKDGKLRISFALVEFATEEAANKAIKFQRLDLLGYDIRLSRQLEDATGAASKRLVMKGLPYFSEKSDVIKFFKQAGEIVDVRFSYNEDGEFSGSGHIEFATEEGEKKAEKLNGLELLGSPVYLRREAKGTGASRTLCPYSFPLVNLM